MASSPIRAAGLHCAFRLPLTICSFQRHGQAHFKDENRIIYYPTLKTFEGFSFNRPAVLSDLRMADLSWSIKVFCSARILHYLPDIFLFTPSPLCSAHFHDILGKLVCAECFFITWCIFIHCLDLLKWDGRNCICFKSCILVNLQPRKNNPVI